jgi:hypothetical protein
MIYADRPARCRRFACRQLEEVGSGLTDENSALEKIGRARGQVDRVVELLGQAGETRTHKPLAVRYAAVFSPPFEEGDAALTARALLPEAMAELTATIVRDFYSEAVGMVPIPAQG